MRTHRLAFLTSTIGVCCLVGCSTAPKSTGQRAELSSEVQAALDGAKQMDPGLQRFFDTAAGYAVFPNVGKGAVGVGGAYGRGQLFQKGDLVGYCSLTQASIGLALGGQSYTEIIFFEDQECARPLQVEQLCLRSSGLGRGSEVRGFHQCTVCRRRGGLYDGRGRADGRGLRGRPEVQFRADPRRGAGHIRSLVAVTCGRDGVESFRRIGPERRCSVGRDVVWTDVSCTCPESPVFRPLCIDFLSLHLDG